MWFKTLAGLTKADLCALVGMGHSRPLTDRDFLETLAAEKCLLIPPAVVRVHEGGGHEPVAAIRYDEHGNIDRPRTLLAVIRYLERANRSPRVFGVNFGGEVA